MVDVAALVANEVAIEATVARVLAVAISKTIVNKLLVAVPVIFSKKPRSFNVIGPEYCYSCLSDALSISAKV